jgi:hypothetical protein
MKKALKSTVDKNKSEKKQTLYLGDYFCMKEMQPRPVTLPFLKLLATKLVEWVEKDETAIHLRQFFQVMGLRPKDYYVWKERCEELQYAHDWAMSLMGMRRELGAIKKQFDSYMISRTLYQYSPEYKEAVEYHSKLAKKESEAANGGVQFVVIPKITSEREDYFKKYTDEDAQ